MDDERSTVTGQHDELSYNNRMFSSNRGHAGMVSPSHDLDQGRSSYSAANAYNGQFVDDQFSEHDSNIVNPLDDRFSEAGSSVIGNGPGELIINANHNGPAVPSQQAKFNSAVMQSYNSQFSHPQDNPYSSRSPSQLSRQQPSVHVPSLLSPSVANSQLLDNKWRNPDLREVIDYLSHDNDAVKVNAAAYLQHLTYMDDNIKAQTRVLRGIPALLDLAQHPLVDVHRAACGALRNLSYGKANDDNKREIKNDGGIAKLVRLLRTTTDSDVRELVTGILWNLSSCADLKRFVIDESLKVLVDFVIKPSAGWDQGSTAHDTNYKSTVFRNASGILRNVSSDGESARRKLRDCDGFVDTLFVIVRTAINNGDMDNKSVENCICILRNLSFACQETIDPEYLQKRAVSTGSLPKDETSGCFGQKKKKSTAKDVKTVPSNGLNTAQVLSRKKEKALWQPDVVHVYLPMLSECNNPDTLEAAAGAIQNLTAGDWQPAADIRTTVRQEKGLPVIVELLALNSDRVVCAAATALRNLALDNKNKELIGKYAIPQLVAKLPAPHRPQELLLSNDTITAVESALYEVIKTNSTHAKSLLTEGGVDSLWFIVRSPSNIYSEKAVRFAAQLLMKMWQFTEFHEEYKHRGWREADFVALKSMPTSADSTLSRGSSRGSNTKTGGHVASSSTDSIVRHQQPSHPSPYVLQHGGTMSNASDYNNAVQQQQQASLANLQDNGRNYSSSLPLYDADNDSPHYVSQSNLERSAQYHQSQNNIDTSVHNYINDVNINYTAEVRPRYTAADKVNGSDGNHYRQFGDAEAGTPLAVDTSYNSPTPLLDVLRISNRHMPVGELRNGSQQYEFDRGHPHEPVYADIQRDSLHGDVLHFDSQTTLRSRANDVDSWV